jgi:hypothetical protein
LWARTPLRALQRPAPDNAGEHALHLGRDHNRDTAGQQQVNLHTCLTPQSAACTAATHATPRITKPTTQQSCTGSQPMAASHRNQPASPTAAQGRQTQTFKTWQPGDRYCGSPPATHCHAALLHSTLHDPTAAAGCHPTAAASRHRRVSTNNFK